MNNLYTSHQLKLLYESCIKKLKGLDGGPQKKVFLSSHCLLFGLRRIETNFVNEDIDTSIFYACN